MVTAEVLHFEVDRFNMCGHVVVGGRLEITELAGELLLFGTLFARCATIFCIGHHHPCGTSHIGWVLFALGGLPLLFP